MATKVWGGNWMGDRRVVAAPTAKRAAELLGVSVGCFRKYGCLTGNDRDIEVALAHPETVFIHADEYAQANEGAPEYRPARGFVAPEYRATDTIARREAAQEGGA